MKTVSMRLRGMTDDGEAVAELLPKLEGMFNDIGLSLKKDNETFKSTYQIFEELAGIWDQLTDFQRANLLEEIAGKRQGVVVASILNNWQDASDALESGLNSSGSAAREMEKISDSVEFKMQQLRNSVIGFWQENIDTEAFKALIDISNKFMQALTAITKKTGLLPPAITVVTTAIILLNSSLLDMVMTNGALIVSFKDLTFSLAAFGAVAKSVGTFIKGAILPVAAITAASFAIQFLTQTYVEYRNEQKKIKEQNDELVRSYSKNTENVNSLILKYKELNEQVVAGRMSESNEEYVAVQNELNSLMPSLTASIDEQGNAHLKSASAIDEEIEYVKQLQEEYNKLTLASFEDDIDEVQKKLNKLRARSGEISEQLLVGSMSDVDRRNLGIEKLSIDRQATQQYDEYANIIRDSIEASLELKGVTNSLTEETWAYIDALVDAQKTSIDGSDSANELSDSIIDQVITVANAKEEIDKLNKSLPTYKDEVANIILKLKDALPEQANLNALLKAFGITVDGVKNDLSGLANVTSDVLNEYKAASSAVETYNQLLNDMAEGKKISAAEAMDLIAKEESLASAITFENGEVRVNIKAVTDMRDAKITAYKDIINASIKKVQAEKADTFATIQGFVNQTKALKTYAEARNALAAKTKEIMNRSGEGGSRKAWEVNQVVEMSTDIATIETKEAELQALLSGADAALKNTPSISKSGSSSKSATKAAEKYERQLEQNFNMLQKIADIERKITNLQNERELLSDSSDIHDNIEQEMAATEELYRATNDLAYIQSEQRKALFAQMKSVSKSVVTVSDDYNRLTVNANAYNKLTDKQKEKIDNLISSYDNLTDAYNDNLQKKLQLKAGIQDLNNELDELLQKAKDEYQEWKDEVNDVADEIIDIYKDFYKKRKNIELSSIDEEIDAEKNRHDRKMDSLEEELDKYKEIIDARLELIDAEAEEEDYNKSLGKLQEERQDIQNKINVLSLDNSIEAKAQREELAKQLAEKEESIEELKTNRTRELRKKNLQDQLENYKKEIKAKQDAENKKYDATKERLEDEKKEIENYYNDIINNERKFAKIRENVLDGNLKNIKNDFADFADYIKENSELIGSSLSNNLIDKIRDAGDALGDIDYGEGKKKKKDAEEAEEIEEENKEYAKYKQPLKSILYWKQQWDRADKSSNAKYKTQIKAQAEEAVQQYYAKLPSDLKNMVKGMNASSLESFINTRVLHSGGVVGKASGLSKLFNEFFNTKPNEQIVKMLEKEIAVPEVNLSKYAIPNLQNLVSRNSGQGNIVHVDKILDIQNFTNNTNTDLDKLIDRATDRFVQRMNGSGYVATVR